MILGPTHQVETLVPMSSLDRSPELLSHRWLLSQLSASLTYHMAYTCKVKVCNNTVQKRPRDKSPILCLPPAEQDTSTLESTANSVKQTLRHSQMGRWKLVQPLIDVHIHNGGHSGSPTTIQKTSLGCH